MDLTELLNNIEKARDAAREDKESFERDFDDAKEKKDVGTMVAANIARGAAEAVEVALSRVLGETKTRIPWDDQPPDGK